MKEKIKVFEATDFLIAHTIEASGSEKIEKIVCEPSELAKVEY